MVRAKATFVRLSEQIYILFEAVSWRWIEASKGGSGKERL